MARKKQTALQKQAAKGGKARANALSAEERSEIARRAVEARWARAGKTKTMRGRHEGDLTIGDIVIPCAVLDDQTRVISQRGFAKALGGATPTGMTRRGDGKLPAFLTASNLKPFIDNELLATAKIVPYVPKHGGPVAFGIPAEAIPRICDVWLKARSEGVLRHNQLHLAKQAEIIIRGLAHVGIIALVDEATGYQDDRARDALAKILEEFVAKELQRWIKTFPAEFYKQVFRLRGWQYHQKVKKPLIVGKITNELVYKRLAPGVLDELKRRNPRTPKGYLKHKHFQWLTDGIGHPKLLEHLHAVTALMKASDDWDTFMRMIDRALPRYPDMPLFEAAGVRLD